MILDDADSAADLTGKAGGTSSSSMPGTPEQEVEQLRQILSLLQGPMGHEFRTPINTIMGFAGILMMESDGRLSEEQKRQVKFIEDAARELLVIANEMFELTRLESSQHKVSIAPVNVDDLIKETLLFNAYLCEMRNVEFDLKIVGPATLLNDMRICRQIVSSIIFNIVRLTENDRVTITAFSEGDQVFLTFVSRNALLNQAGLVDLFKPFSRLAVGAEFQIVGLGFFLARRLARYMGGDLAPISCADEPLALRLKLTSKGP